MKKLMTMIAAVAMSFGLFADGVTPYAISFETEDDGVIEKTWNAANAGWTTTQTDAFTLGDQLPKAQLPYATGRDRRDNLFQGLVNNFNFLKLETGTNTLVHTIGTDQVYFDQLVKFTGYEEDPTIAADAKIAVWLSAIDTEDYVPEQKDEEGAILQEASGTLGATNLYVTVGKGDGTATKVQVAGDFKVDQWYRVTIKSIGDVSSGLTSQLGFQLFIDGQAASIVEGDDRQYNDNSDSFNATAAALYAKGQLFTAIDMSNLTLAKVAYQGIGGVDDIIFSQEAPDFDSFVDVTFAPITGAEIVSITDAKGNVIPFTANPVRVAAGEMEVTIKAAPGYILKKDGQKVDTLVKTATAAASVTITLDEEDYVEAVAKIGTTYFETLEEALAEVKDNDTVEILKGATSADGNYTFSKGTSIAVTAGGNWAVTIGYSEEGIAGTLTDKFGAMPEKQITVTGVDGYAFNLCGNIYGNGRVDTLVQASTVTISGGNLKIGDTLAAQDGAGAVLKADAITFGKVGRTDTAKIELIGKGKVMTKDGTLTGEQIIVPDGEDLDISGPDADNYYTYQIKQAPQETGFAIIIADAVPAVTNYYPTLEAAIEAYNGAGAVTLMADYEMTTGIVIAKPVVFDMNGKTMTATYATTKAAYVPPINILANGDLTITGNGAIVAWADDAAAALDSKPVIRVMGELTYLNGTLMAGGTGDSGLYGVGIFDGGAATFGDDNGGPSITSWFAAVAGNNLNAPVTVTINDGTFTQLADGTGAWWSYFCGAVYAPAQGTYTINGGTFNGALYSVVTRYNDVATVIDIEDGTFNDAMLVGEVASQATEKGTRVVTKDADVTLALAGTDHYWFDGTMLGKKTDAVAKIGDDELFLTLASAVAAAETTDTITVLQNITLTETLEIAKTTTIDLNGKTVTFGDALTKGINTANDSGTLTILNGTFAVTGTRTNLAKSRAIMLNRTNGVFADLVINVPGFEYVLDQESNLANRYDYWDLEPAWTLDCENVAINGNGSLFHIENAKATLDDCSATATGTSFGGAHEAAIYSSCGSIVTVNGGTFTAPNALQTGNLGGTIIVSEGEFNGNIKSYMYKGDARYPLSNEATIKISDGVFNGDFVYATDQAGECTKDEVIWDITGGQFKADPTAYLVPPYVATYDQETKYYTVAQSVKEPVATVDGVEYTDLHEAMEQMTDSTKTLELLCNVDLAGKEDWVPVTGFAGTFDGKGFIISNLTVTAVVGEKNNTGFIGSGSVSMHDVTFANASVEATVGQSHAVILGQATLGSSFVNVTIVDSTLAGVKYVGLLVGHTANALTFENITVTGNTITGDAQISALGGYSEGLLTVTDVEISDNTITGNSKVGAIWGRSNVATFAKTFTNVVVDQPDNALIGGMYAGINTFTGDDTDVNVNAFYNTQEGSGTASIRAGTWSLDPTVYVPEVGYKVTDNGDGTWTVEALAAIALTISAENATVDGIEAGTVYEGSNLTFTVAANTGYKLVDVKANGTVLTADDQGNYTYAVTGEEAEQALAIVVTVEQEAQPIDPEQPVPSTDPAGDAAKMNDENGNVKPECINVPKAAGTTPEAKAAYAALFSAVPGNGEVEIKLNKAGTNALETATAAIETAVANKLGDITAAAAGATLDFGTVTENVTPGFWYGVAVTTELGSMKTTNPATWVQATADGVELKATKPATGNAAFFQTKAKVTNK